MRTFTLLLFLIFTIFCFGQPPEINTNPWTFVSNSRNNLPTFSKKLYLNSSFLKILLKQTPNRFDNQSTSSTILSLPLPNGIFQQFYVLRSSNFHPALAKKFPDIQSFVGIGVDDPTATLHFDISPKGFHAMIRSGKHRTVFIEPIKTEKETYQVFYKHSERPAGINCTVKEMENGLKNNLKNKGVARAGDCNLRTYRLALACTAEYTAYHGGTTADALAAMNTTLTRINGIFENDLSIRLELIANNTELIFFDVQNDPYTNSDVGAMLDENQNTCELIIGVENFDIGHVLGTGGGGGVAFLGVICEDRFKASGATSFFQPEGDIFDIELVSHEIGHQFGANHTFNGDSGACGGSNRNEGTAVETGSGSTIMSYAGICNNQNVETNSDAYFHAISLQQIAAKVAVEDCGTEIMVNTAPTISHPASTYFIPKSTPFFLTASGSDAETSNLTYTWEQMDREISIQPPQSTNIEGPLFRSFPPSSDPTRFFPNLIDVLSNSVSEWEVLPTVPRQMNFRGTIRDNQLVGGCTEETDVKIFVTDSEPFEVTFPNSPLVLSAGTQQTVTWNTGLTNDIPISADKVDILLSIDGGLNYPITLWENTPNDGSEIILIPNLVTTGARIMVRASNNIFFDISDQNFEIVRPENDFDITVTPTTQKVCGREGTTFSVIVEPLGNFEDTVDLTTKGLPSWIGVNFSNNNQVPPFESTLTISKTEQLNDDITFELVAKAEDTSEKNRVLNLGYAPNKTEGIDQISPANNELDVAISPIFSWEAVPDVDFYRLEISTSANFSNPIFLIENITATTFPFPHFLENDANYFWRVVGVNDCGIGTYNEFYYFKTFDETCRTFQPPNLPVPISATNSPTIISNLEVNVVGRITNIKVHNLEITHSYISDLQIDLESPVGTVVNLIDRVCESSQNMNLNFDSRRGVPYTEGSCPPTSGQIVQPRESLQNFLGENMAGTWHLIVKDKEIQDGGSLDDWSLEICYNQDLPLELTVENKSVKCAGGNDGMITLTPIGGLGNYTYNWDNGVTTAVNTGLVAGNYQVTVSDGTSFIDTLIQVREPDSLSAEFALIQAGCSNENTGAINTEVAGGLEPYRYAWSTGSTDANIMNLAPDIYTLTLTDRNNCELIISDTIIRSNNSISGLTAENVSCFGAIDGSIDLEVTDENIIYLYSWSNGGTTQDLENLIAGTYTVTVTTGGCQEVGTIVVEQPDEILITGNPIGISCHGEEDGQISVDITGGTLPYRYEWSNNLSEKDVENLGPNNYTLVVKDVNECQGFEQFMIVEPTPLSAETASTNISESNAKDGTAEVIVSGGTPDYTYEWSTGEKTQKVENLAKGIYIVTITDTNGCTIGKSVNVGGVDCSAIKVELGLILPSCNGREDGEIVAIVEGGLAPYKFNWSTGVSTQQISNLTAGTYEVTITDEAGCFQVESTVLAAATPLNLIITNQNNPNCNNGNLGAVALDALNATGVVLYEWSNGLVGAIQTELETGIYSITATDRNNCTDEIMVEIAQEEDQSPPVIRTRPLTLYVDDIGVANFQVSQIDNGTIDDCGTVHLMMNRSTFDCESLGNQFVDLTAEDEVGNRSMDRVAVTVLDTIAPVFDCPNEIQSDGCGNVTPSVYPTAFDNCLEVSVSLVQPGQLGFVNDPNVLTFRAIDGSSNQSFCTVPFIQDKVAPVFDCPTELIIRGCQNIHPSQYPIATDNCSTPTVTLVSEEYLDESKQAGVLTFIAEDSFGNQTFCSVPFRRDDNLSATMDIIPPTCVGDFDASATVFPQGGIGPYTYLWNDQHNQTTSTAIGLSAGTYFAAITDATGCSHFAEVTVTDPTPIIIESKEIMEAINDNADGSIAINIIGGAGNLSIQWFRNDTLISSNKNISGLKAGDYKVVVIDGNGCAASETFTVEQKVVITSDNEAELGTEFNLFPNPTEGQVYLTFDIVIPKELTIEIFDLTGRFVTSKIEKHPSENGYVIDMKPLENGVYFVKLNVGDKLLTRKVLLLN